MNSVTSFRVPSKKLKSHDPEFVSVTFGAGGSTLSATPETVRELRQTHGLNGVPHLSCMGGTREEIAHLLQLYKALGCNRVVALRGDLPSRNGAHGRIPLRLRSRQFYSPGTRRFFPYRSRLLSGNTSAGRRCLARPETFQEKMDAGANSAITQYFYNADAYFTSSIK